MKKFAFLLAIVAVFAMSASAFAVDAESVTALGAPTALGNSTIVPSAPADEKATGVAYYLAGTTPSLDIAVKVTFNAADSVTDYQTIAVVSGDIVDGGKEPAATPGADNTFVIGKAHTDYSKVITMTIGALDDSGDFITTSKSGDLKITPKSVDICLSADGAAQPVINAYLSNELNKALSLDITKDTLTTTVDASLKLAIISSDQKTIISEDATAANVIAGLTIAKDTANKSITIKGTPTAEGEYILAAYVDDEPKVSDASVAGITKSIGTVAADKFVLACTKITVEKTDADLINDAIKASAVSKDLAAANDGKGGPVSLVMNAAGQIVSADLSKEQIALGKTGSLEIKIISLDLKGASSVDKVAAWGADSNAALAAVVSDDENGGKQLMTIAPTKAADGISSILTYDVNAAKLLPARAASVDVDYARTISFPTTVGAKAVKVVVTETVERGDTSSGGACDMGLGLAAAALALVILKKRG